MWLRGNRLVWNRRQVGLAGLFQQWPPYLETNSQKTPVMTFWLHNPCFNVNFLQLLLSRFFLCLDFLCNFFWKDHVSASPNLLHVLCKQIVCKVKFLPRCLSCHASVGVIPSTPLENVVNHFPRQNSQSPESPSGCHSPLMTIPHFSHPLFRHSLSLSLSLMPQQFYCSNETMTHFELKTTPLMLSTISRVCRPEGQELKLSQVVKSPW